jgi:hypothetical protein
MSVAMAVAWVVALVRARLGEARRDERGQVVQTVLLIAGFGVLAVAVVAGITAIVNGIIDDIPKSATP